MRTNSCLVLAAALAGALTSPAQRLDLMSGVNSVANGVHVAYRTVLEPAAEGSPRYRLGGGVIGDRGIHRYVQAGDVYFGYDVVATPVHAGRDIELRLEPLTLSPADLSRLLAAATRWGTLPALPAPVTVPSGSTVEVEILRNPSTGQRVVDLLTVAAAAPTPPRDWALRLVAPVATAGNISARTPATLTGDLIRLEVPNHGVFSLGLLALRSKGFQPVGEVDGTLLRFQWGGESFEIQSKAAIVPGGGRWTLYGRFTPRGAVPALTIGTGDL